MATGAAAAVAKARRDVISHFLSRHAVTEESAVPYAPSRRLRARQFEKLRARGVVVTAKSGGYYVDVAAWDAFQRTIRKRVLGGLAVGVIAAALAVAFGV